MFSFFRKSRNRNDIIRYSSEDEIKVPYGYYVSDALDLSLEVSSGLAIGSVMHVESLI